jgi:uncharacterized membrane protein HdeD (DUF308 family)
MMMSVEAAAQALREATREVVRRYSTWYLIQGVLMVLAGIVALIYPFVSTVALVVVLGWLLILSGIVQGISLIGAQNVPNFWLQLVSVVLSIIVGVLFLRRPGEAVVTLTLLLIVFFMVEGFAKLLFSLTIRPLPNWGWVFASGIIGILLSFYLLANLTTTAVWLLGVLLGIQLIFEGVALSSLAWQVRRKMPVMPIALTSFPLDLVCWWIGGFGVSRARSVRHRRSSLRSSIPAALQGRRSPNFGPLRLISHPILNPAVNNLPLAASCAESEKVRPFILLSIGRTESRPS